MMMPSKLRRILLLGTLSVWASHGCAYVSRQEFLDAWDRDGDGWPVEDDCEPKNKDYFPYAPDRRGDGCDNDCGTEPDRDGDDFPDAADCNPDDPTIFPCSPYEVETDVIDHDCDGLPTTRPDDCNTDDPDYPDTEVPCTPDEGDES